MSAGKVLGGGFGAAPHVQRGVDIHEVNAHGVDTESELFGDFLVRILANRLIGAVAGAWALSVVAGGQTGFTTAAGFAANGYGEHSPGKYTLAAGFTAELVLTFFFLLIILGATDPRAPQGFAPMAIGLGLTLIHLIGIAVAEPEEPVRQRVARKIIKPGKTLFPGSRLRLRYAIHPVLT